MVQAGGAKLGGGDGGKAAERRDRPRVTGSMMAGAGAKARVKPSAKPSSSAKAVARALARSQPGPGKSAGAGPSMVARRAHFLEILRQTANVSRAARDAGIPSSTLYGQRVRLAGFARAWDLAMAEALDTLEEVLIARARDGVEKPVFYGGEVKGSVRVYSDQLAMFLLRARRPEIYDRLPPQPGAPATTREMTEAEAGAEFELRLKKVRERGAND